MNGLRVIQVWILKGVMGQDYLMRLLFQALFLKTMWLLLGIRRLVNFVVQIVSLFVSLGRWWNFLMFDLWNIMHWFTWFSLIYRHKRDYWLARLTECYKLIAGSGSHGNRIIGCSSVVHADCNLYRLL